MESTWIDVKDRLPEKEKRVLVKVSNNCYIKEHSGGPEGIWYDGETHCYCPVGEIHGVTHWQHLPRD
jgi:hypothetical protein